MLAPNEKKAFPHYSCSLCSILFGCSHSNLLSYYRLTLYFICFFWFDSVTVYANTLLYTHIYLPRAVNAYRPIWKQSHLFILSAQQYLLCASSASRPIQVHTNQPTGRSTVLFVLSVWFTWKKIFLCFFFSFYFFW